VNGFGFRQLVLSVTVKTQTFTVSIGRRMSPPYALAPAYRFKRWRNRMPMTVDELMGLRRMTVHRLHLLETGEMSVRCLRTAKLDNSTAIAATREQIANIDNALAVRGHKGAGRTFIGLQASAT
jgi:hypothetical protein